MRIAVIGSNGQLGTDLCEVLADSHEVVRLTHSDVDITDFHRTQEILRKIRPGIVVNTAAAHNVPRCEEDPDFAYKVNASAVLNMSRLSNEQQFVLVHYSTDYVFDGGKKKPYVEGDATNPLNVYGATKALGENYVKSYCERGFVVRVSGIYGKVPCRAKGGSNFITTMLRLAAEKPEVSVVNDEILTPTSTFDIAKNTSILIEKLPDFGVYHMTNAGECSWYEFAHEIFRMLRIKTPLLETTSDRFPTALKRPRYSVLENAALQSKGLDEMPHWKDSLEQFLKMNFK